MTTAAIAKTEEDPDSPASFNVRMTVYGPVYPGPGEQQYMRYVVNPPSAPRRPTQRPGVYKPTRPSGWDYSRPPPTTSRPRIRDITARIALAQTRCVQSFCPNCFLTTEYISGSL